jgi:hypothetical protein
MKLARSWVSQGSHASVPTNAIAPFSALILVEVKWCHLHNNAHAHHFKNDKALEWKLNPCQTIG